MIVLKLQSDEGIFVSHPDGAYCRIKDDVAQIIVVGPMQGAPLDYEFALRELSNEDWVIGSGEFMTSPKGGEINMILLRRGFVSLMFRKRPASEQIDPEPITISPEEAKLRMVA